RRAAARALPRARARPGVQGRGGVARRAGAGRLDAGGGHEMSERNRLLELLTELAYEKRKVVLSSGKESDFYIDTKQASLTAEGHYLVGRLVLGVVALVDREEGGHEAVEKAGVELRSLFRRSDFP